MKYILYTLILWICGCTSIHSATSTVLVYIILNGKGVLIVYGQQVLFSKLSGGLAGVDMDPRVECVCKQSA